MSIKRDKKPFSDGVNKISKFSETQLKVSIKYCLSVSYDNCVDMAAKYSAAR